MKGNLCAAVSRKNPTEQRPEAGTAKGVCLGRERRGKREGKRAGEGGKGKGKREGQGEGAEKDRGRNCLRNRKICRLEEKAGAAQGPCPRCTLASTSSTGVLRTGNRTSH